VAYGAWLAPQFQISAATFKAFPPRLPQRDEPMTILVAKRQRMATKIPLGFQAKPRWNPAENAVKM
jgi:hypothetical protein